MSSGDTVNSSASSVPSESRVELGRRNLNLWLRSIVMSRSTFLLFHGFNPVEDNVVSMRSLLLPDERRSSSNAARLDFTRNMDNGGFLLDCWKCLNSETQITKKVSARLNERVFSGGQLATSVSEASFPVDETQNGPRLDIAFGETSTSAEVPSLVGFVEVGLTASGISTDKEPEKIDHLFWKKVCQATLYLQLLLETEKVKGDGYVFSVGENKTLMLCVLVTNRQKTQGRIAVFACEPKMGDPEQDGSCYWRMALMWRKEGDAKQISAAFGYYIESIKFMAENRLNLDEDDEKWTYLGPNCSKVTVQDFSGQVRE